MKILKLLFVIAIVSMIAVSCKESKKEEVSDDAAVEMNEDATSDDAAKSEDKGESTSGAAATGAAATGAAASSDADESDESASHESSEAIEGAAKDVEEVPVPEGVIAEELADTPVVYPGCRGTVDEIRACNREKFIAYLRDEFNSDLAKDLGLRMGDHEIVCIVHIDKTGKCHTLRVNAPHKVLEEEAKRVIESVPQLVPATKNREPIGVTFKLPLNFKVVD